ncbi:MAG: AMP-binding protein [Bdellovibrionales bacterium]|nr:AMP-binding protein [Bdellovibrionales bacterium]
MRDQSTLLHRLKLWARDQPQQPALHFRDDAGWTPIVVSHYWLQVVRFALALRDFGLERGDRVMLYAQNSPEWVQWELAVWLTGGISVGVHPHTQDAELVQMLDQCRPRLVLVESDLYRNRISPSEEVHRQVLTFGDAVGKILSIRSYSQEEIEARGDALLNSLNPEETCMVIYTSGTTGTPKGVMLGLRQLTFVAEVLSREWRLPYMDGQLFSFLPLAHVAEKVQTMAVALVQRYPVWFNSNYERFFQELLEVRPSLLLAVPRVWERLKEQVESRKPKLLQRAMEFDRVGKIAEKVYLSQVRSQLGLDRLKFAVSGAAKLPPAVGQWFKTIGIEIQEIYGMSESAGLITLTRPERGDFKTVGSVPAGVEVRIMMDGEIQVRGPQVFFGYWGSPESTREVLTEDAWLLTGDLGEFMPELAILGRNRDIIKLSNGRMVAPLPIENALKELPEVSNVCVVGEGKSGILALITLKEEVIVDLRFTPGAIEGLSVENEELKKKIAAGIERLVREKRIPEAVSRFVILSRDFSVDLKELTQTQKLNRNQIQKSFRPFIDLQFES